MRVDPFRRIELSGSRLVAYSRFFAIGRVVDILQLGRESGILRACRMSKRKALNYRRLTMTGRRIITRISWWTTMVPQKKLVVVKGRTQRVMATGKKMVDVLISETETVLDY